MNAAVAAGHPATVEAGAEILRAGGTAADAAVAASLASCVAETVMTGLLGGGHAIYYDASTGRARNLDCFVAVPGIGAERRDAELVELDVPFGAELIHYAVGIASCGVPGLPGGLDELWRSHGRLEWSLLVEPALALARSGVEMPAAHAACLEMLAPVMTMDEGARIYSPGGSLLATGDVLDQPGLVRALELIADEGAASVYSGSIAAALLELIGDRGGLVTRADLDNYAARWSEPEEVAYIGLRFLSRGDFSLVPETISALPRVAGLDEAKRALVLARAFDGPSEDTPGDTTNITVLDEAGNACVLTTSLGLGSGDFVPSLDLHLNSMLGEADLLRGPLSPGQRMSSMMAPSLALDHERVALAAGAAGGTRLRSALIQVVSAILDERLTAANAVERPRLHASAGRVQLEPGFSDSTVEALERAGFGTRVWPARHHFFGGVSVAMPDGAAGDPRRSGGSATVR